METLFPNGWIHYAAGGALVGLGTALVFLGTGIRAGASGFFGSSWSWVSRDPRVRSEWALAERDWRALFALGLLVGAGLLTLLLGRGAFVTAVEPWRLALGGVLVGLGTRASRGCTSGHGICGTSSGDRASIASVLVFMGVAIAVALAVESAGVRP